MIKKMDWQRAAMDRRAGRQGTAPIAGPSVPKSSPKKKRKRRRLSAADLDLLKRCVWKS
jgi:hypothetical protein